VRRRLRELVAGSDGPGKRALPLGEFLHPLPLLALTALAINDHLLKGAHLLPMWLTGKISDFAGLFFFPLLLTAAGDCLLMLVARTTGWRIDFSLRRWKLVAACLATAAVAVPLELSESFGRFYTETLGRLGFPSATYRDLSDLLALLMLPLAYRFGVHEVRRLPLGRLEVIARRGRTDQVVVAAQLADLGAERSRPLAQAYAAWLRDHSDERGAAVDRALDELRR
jgi:hypothetical protein